MGMSSASSVARNVLQRFIMGKESLSVIIVGDKSFSFSFHRRHGKSWYCWPYMHSLIDLGRKEPGAASCLSMVCVINCMPDNPFIFLLVPSNFHTCQGPFDLTWIWVSVGWKLFETLDRTRFNSSWQVHYISVCKMLFGAWLIMPKIQRIFKHVEM